MAVFPVLKLRPSTQTKYSDVENFTNFVEFGRGYSQRSSEYKQGVRRSINVVYEYLDNEDTGILMGFLEENSTGVVVYMPDWCANSDGLITRKWTIINWSMGYSSPTTHNFSISLKEVCDPS